MPLDVKKGVIMSVIKFMIHIHCIFKSCPFKTSFPYHLFKLPINVLINHQWRLIVDWTFKTLETAKACRKSKNSSKFKGCKRNRTHLSNFSFSFYPQTDVSSKINAKLGRVVSQVLDIFMCRM